MSLVLSPWEWLSLLCVILGCLSGFGKVLISQVEKRLDARFTVLDNIAQANDRRLTQLLIDLPLQYQRREDAIRQEVAIIHRLDALAGKVDALRCQHQASCSGRSHHD